MKELKTATQAQLDDSFYDGYGEYIYNNADPECVLICNGDTLLEAMESGYLWDEFLASKGLTEA